ncbi:MAG: CDGSH iron-sulfur domain-containing protein [Paludibacter sp.]|nr:CDGSH iron-sulfur domain-containing protein [Paludibacter sp.]
MDNSTQFSVKVIKGGPYVVSGNFKLDLPSGEVKECVDKTFFCRCGHSNNKPFCDGSHAKNDFDK